MKRLLWLMAWAAAWAQSEEKVWNPGRELQKSVASESGGKVSIMFESRYRFEGRENGNFGKDVDRNYNLLRHRFGLSYKPAAWLKISGMVQDSRAPLYGPGAPNNLRDAADLHEGYVELFPGAKQGFGLFAGRSMLNYGEGRLLGTPQWSNLARTYDNAHVSYKTKRVQWEVLLASPVKVKPLEFNTPNLGERVWGTYNVVPEVAGRSTAEFYILRHDQNRIGGFTGGSRAAGTDRLGTNTFGGRMAGPLAPGWKYSVEGAWQTGKIGGVEHFAAAWFSSAARRWIIGKRPLDASAEYKFASGTSDAARSATFDQLLPANHDKFGHEDLFGWRNIHNARSLWTLGWTKRVSFNLMYDSFWLASRTDALYNGSGRPIVRSADGKAGRHVGQELDAFATWKLGPYLAGGGYGYFFNGPVIRNLTPNASPTYVYVFTSYSF